MLNREDNESFIRYSNVVATNVEWLWYPYIPFGKITVLQGDPGEGKSTLMMNIIGAVTQGGALPGRSVSEPINVIYQCSEDDAADTIKPRLVAAGADCDRVAFINEDSFCSAMALDDEKFRLAVKSFKARLLVIDPFQAYLGEADISNATSIRRIIRRLSLWANNYNCAVVLIGHLNKNQGSKDLYRGLGSIDVIAAARSVIQIERSEDDESVRVLKQIKNSLSAKARDRFFSIDGNSQIHWENAEDTEVMIPDTTCEKMNKQELAAKLIRDCLLNGPAKASDVIQRVSFNGIGEKTIQNAKRMSGIISVKRQNAWYWALPGEDNI